MTLNGLGTMLHVLLRTKEKIIQWKIGNSRNAMVYQRLGSLGVSTVPFNLSIPVRNPPGAYGVKNISL